MNGKALSSTLEPASGESIDVSLGTLQNIQGLESGQSPVRAITVAGSEYWEVLAPLVVRQGTENLGVLGISLLRVPVEGTAEDGLPVVLRFGALALALIVLIGLLLSNSITKRLGELVKRPPPISPAATWRLMWMCAEPMRSVFFQSHSTRWSKDFEKVRSIAICWGDR